MEDFGIDVHESAKLHLYQVRTLSRQCFFCSLHQILGGSGYCGRALPVHDTPCRVCFHQVINAKFTWWLHKRGMVILFGCLFFYSFVYSSPLQRTYWDIFSSLWKHQGFVNAVYTSWEHKQNKDGMMFDLSLLLCWDMWTSTSVGILYVIWDDLKGSKMVWSVYLITNHLQSTLPIKSNPLGLKK